MIRHRRIPVFVFLFALLTFALLGEAPRPSPNAAVNTPGSSGSAASPFLPPPASGGSSALTVRILSPAQGARLSDPFVAVQAQATGGPFLEILLYADGVQVDHLNPEKNPGFGGTLVWKGAQPGKHRLKVMVVDWNKNTAEAETDIEVVTNVPASPAKPSAPLPAPAPASPSLPLPRPSPASMSDS